MIIKDAWGDGRGADVLDARCVDRDCLNIGEDKGTFARGRGYTRYHRTPKLCCMTRHMHGCPPEVNDEEPTP